MTMDNENIIREARALMAADRGSHGWDHVDRVLNLCRRIALQEGADLEVLEAAAILHDIGRSREKEADGRVCHARIGAEEAGRILRRYQYPVLLIDRVVSCIATHRFRGNGDEPGSLEAKVLFDADKLDSIGAVGVGRAFLFAGEVGARLHNSDLDISNTRAYSREDTAYREFSVKLHRIKDRMLTATGKRLARKRHEFMVAYFKRLDEEVRGRE